MIDFVVHTIKNARFCREHTNETSTEPGIRRSFEVFHIKSRLWGRLLGFYKVKFRLVAAAIAVTVALFPTFVAPTTVATSAAFAPKFAAHATAPAALATAPAAIAAAARTTVARAVIISAAAPTASTAPTTAAERSRVADFGGDGIAVSHRGRLARIIDDCGGIYQGSHVSSPSRRIPPSPTARLQGRGEQSRLPDRRQAGKRRLRRRCRRRRT